MALSLECFSNSRYFTDFESVSTAKVFGRLTSTGGIFLDKMSALVLPWAAKKSISLIALVGVLARLGNSFSY